MAKGGKVELRAVITLEDKTKELVVLGGDPAFSNSALAAIRKWRFRPVSMQGRPVQTAYNVHVSFNPGLQEANSNVELESPRSEATLVLWANLPDSADGTIYKSYEPGVVSSKPIYSPLPEFTERARTAQDQGMVTLYLAVGSDGLPQDVRPVCGPAPDLTEQAIESVKLWKFSPGSKDGKAVSVAVLLEVRFELH